MNIADLKLIAECATGWDDVRLAPDIILALVADAERYRWLRDKSEAVNNFYLSTPIWLAGAKFSPEDVDSSIDAAIREGGSLENI